MLSSYIPAFALLGFLGTSMSAPMDYRNNNFGAPDPNHFNFHHYDLDNIHNDPHELPPLPPSYDSNQGSHYQGYHQYGYSNSPPQTRHQAVDDHYELPPLPPSYGSSQTTDYSGHQQYGYSNSPPHANYGVVDAYANIPYYSSGPSHHWNTNEAYHSFNPSTFGNLHLSDEVYPEAQTSHSQYESLPAYNAPLQASSPSPQAVGSPIRGDESPTASNEGDENMLNNRHEQPDAEIARRPKRLRKYPWQRFYERGELMKLYERMFVWDALPRKTATDYFSKLNEKLGEKPQEIESILYGDQDRIQILAFDWGPRDSKNRPLNYRFNRDVYDKESFLKWINKN